MSIQPILDAGQQWAEAERRMDAAALDPLLDEDFAAVGPRGFVLSRQQWLDRYHSGDLKNDEFDWQEVNVRELPSSAVTIQQVNSSCSILTSAVFHENMTFLWVTIFGDGGEMHPVSPSAMKAPL